MPPDESVGIYITTPSLINLAVTLFRYSSGGVALEEILVLSF